MKLTLPVALVALTILLSSVLTTAATAGNNYASDINASKTKDVKESELKSATRLYGHLNGFGAACISGGITPVSTQLPTFIEKVKPGSPAFYAGVCQGDKILSASAANNQLSLTIKRNEQIYLVKIRAKADSLNKTLSSQTVALNLWDRLKDFKIVFVLDHSGSMSRPVGSSDKLRWQWIKEQLGEFTREAERTGHFTFDLCLFNDSFNISKNLTALEFNQNLESAVTTGNTSLTPALKAVLEQAALDQSGKSPLLFVVTDGQGLAGSDSIATIQAHAAKLTKQKKLKLIFIQTGYSEDGLKFVAQLKSAASGSKGACEVDSILFEEVSQTGLAQAIKPFFTR